MTDLTDPAELLRSFSPDLRAPSFEPSDVSYVIEDTVVGRLLLARNASGALVASAFTPDVATEDRLLARLSERVSPRVLRHPRALDDVRAELESFLAGRTRAFSVPTDLSLASDFQRQVLPRLASSVGYGERATYGQLAALLNRPSAARAVGAALGANPLCVVIPCHRVVAASGALTGYAGGLAAKEYLLALEGAAR